jgi:DNA-binding NtrC family response regulator
MEQNNFAEENKSKSQPLSFEDRRNALVCIGDDDLKQKIYSTIDQMGFSADTVNNTKAALKKMDYHIYHLVIMDETFDQNKGITGLIDTINSIDMYLRRRMCLVLVSDQFKSNDDMAALHASVNKVIQLDDINHLDTFLSKALVEHKNFYTVYNESLKLAGRA